MKGDSMPNWVQNVIKIKSEDKTLLKEIKDFLSEGDSVFNFSKIIPMPEDETDWYNWNISNWGTKWNASDTELASDSTDSVLTYYYNTAWAPALPVLVKLTTLFPTISLFTRFVEEQGWGGEVEISKGITNVIKEWDSPSSHKEQITLLGHCYCSEDTQFFPDCFSERASVENVVDSRSKETVDAIGPEWSGTYTGLVDIAKIL
jgi:hypothetical protein